MLGAELFMAPILPRPDWGGLTQREGRLVDSCGGPLVRVVVVGLARDFADLPFLPCLQFRF